MCEYDALLTIVSRRNSSEVIGEAEGFHGSPNPRPDADTCTNLGECMRRLVEIHADAFATEFTKSDSEGETSNSATTSR